MMHVDIETQYTTNSKIPRHREIEELIWEFPIAIFDYWGGKRFNDQHMQICQVPSASQAMMDWQLSTISVEEMLTAGFRFAA